MTLTLERRAELRRQPPADGDCENNGVVSIQKWELIALLDALDAAERIAEQARADKAEAYALAGFLWGQARDAERSLQKLRLNRGDA